MSVPKISVLLSVRNEEKFLSAALDSALHQSFKNWEMIAIDDGSTDGTFAILEQKAEKDARIRIFKRPAFGLVSALNFGLKQCRADLIARFDGDDICHPERLKLQYAAMQKNPKVDVLGSRVRHFPRPRIQGGMLAYEDWQNELLSHEEIVNNLFVESPLANPSVMIRKEMIDRIGGYQEREWAEDYDLWLRMAECDAQFVRLPQTLLYWRDHPERMTRTAKCCSLDAFRKCKVHFLGRGLLADSDSVWIWGAGVEGKRWRKCLAEIQIEVNGWIDVDPKKNGRIIQGAEVISHLEIPAVHPLILVCVGTKGVRQQIRDFCDTAIMIEGKDYLCVT